MSLNRFVLPVIVAGTIACPAWAAQPISSEPGFSGFVNLGIGMVNAETNTLATFSDVDVGEDPIDSLDDPAKSEIDYLPIIALSLNYTFSNKTTELFLGSSIENMAVLDFSTNLGVRQQIGDAGIIELSALTTPMAAEVWEDPYVTGAARDETDRDIDGARLQWGNIMGSNFDLAVSSREIDIDTERSGDALVAATTITASEQGLLDRNGDINIVSATYTWYMDDGLLSLGFNSIDYDLDGKAMAYDGFSVEIDHVKYFSQRTKVVSKLGLGYFEFDDDNPIYDEEDEMDTAEFSVTLLVDDPFGYKNWVFNTGFAFGQEDHDINFYDNDVSLISIGAMWNF
ncbi:MAG: DUF2860 family protein [Gammaproteobacteria bacterium]|nr:DUF2860 family protein [Gammaproteobacteria bacterium]